MVGRWISCFFALGQFSGAHYVSFRECTRWLICLLVSCSALLTPNWSSKFGWHSGTRDALIASFLVLLSSAKWQVYTRAQSPLSVKPTLFFLIVQPRGHGSIGSHRADFYVVADNRIIWPLHCDSVVHSDFKGSIVWPQLGLQWCQKLLSGRTGSWFVEEAQRTGSFIVIIPNTLHNFETFIDLH